MAQALFTVNKQLVNEQVTIVFVSLITVKTE